MESEWENSIAVLPFKNLSADQDQEYFSDGITEQIIMNLSKLSNIKVIASQSIMRFKDTKKKKYLRLQKQYINKALEINPNLAEVQYAKGSVDYVNGEKEEAITSWKKAIQLNPNYHLAYYLLGSFFLNRDLLDLAITCYSKAIESDPMFPQYYAHRAFCYVLLRDYTEAENDFIKAMTIDQNNPIVLTLYIFLLIELERYSEAELIYQRIDRYNPDFIHLKLVRSIRYALNGEKDKIIENYEDLISHDNLMQLWLNIFIYALAGMKDEFFNCSSWGIYEKMGITYYFHLKNNRVFDSVRSDPRFQEILAKNKELYEENLRKYGDLDI